MLNNKIRYINQNYELEEIEVASSIPLPELWEDFWNEVNPSWQRVNSGKNLNWKDDTKKWCIKFTKEGREYWHPANREFLWKYCKRMVQPDIVVHHIDHNARNDFPKNIILLHREVHYGYHNWVRQNGLKCNIMSLHQFIENLKRSK